MTTGRNSLLVPVWSNWPTWSFHYSKVALNDAAVPSLCSTYRSVHTCWCCSCKYLQTDTFHHTTLCWPVMTDTVWATRKARRNKDRKEIFLILTGLLLRQSFFLMVILTVTFWHDFPSSLPAGWGANEQYFSLTVQYYWITSALPMLQ